jgi:succinate dehydrogenase / fumarate reductase flavoprotein subunit
MGGIPCNYHGEVLKPEKGNPDAIVQGLFAVGEAACVSVHGANRLGSNSLIDLVVFGRATAHRIAETQEKGKQKAMPSDSADMALGRLDKFRFADGGTPTAEIRDTMQRAMQSHCAVFREGKFLKEGCDKIDDVYASMADIKTTDRSLVWNSDLIETMEMDNLIRQASVTMHGAENRKESRGAHMREDFPDRDDKQWMKHTIAYFGEDGKVKFDYRPVHDYTMSDEIEYIKPKARVY